MHIFNITTNAIRVAIPDLGVRIEPGEEVEVDSSVLSTSADLKRALAVGIVRVRLTTEEQDTDAQNIAQNRTIRRAARNTGIVPSVTDTMIMSVTDAMVTRVSNVRRAFFINAENVGL